MKTVDILVLSLIIFAIGILFCRESEVKRSVALEKKVHTLTGQLEANRIVTCNIHLYTMESYGERLFAEFVPTSGLKYDLFQNEEFISKITCE